jgi:hypothetical protein
MNQPVRIESVRVHFTDEEILQLGERLAVTMQEVYELQNSKKLLVKELSAQIEMAEARVADLTRKVNQRYEMRDMECTVLLSTPRKGMKTIIRPDTDEVICEEAMTPAEMQQTFTFPEGTKTQ